MACSNAPDGLTLDALRDQAHLQLLDGDLELLQRVVEDLGAAGQPKLGDLGERIATEFFENAGWRDPGFTPGHQGIDRVFVHDSGRAAIVEIKTTFHGTPRPSSTQSGRQLSDTWVDVRLERMADPADSQGQGQNPQIAAALRAAGLQHVERLLVVTRVGGAEPVVDAFAVDGIGAVGNEVDLRDGSLRGAKR